MSVLEEVRAIAGAEALPGEETSFRVQDLVPEVVAAPADAAGAAALLRLASGRGWRVELAGGGAGLGAGLPPAGVELLVTTSRLRDVPEYAPADLTAALGAGVTLGELAERLEANRQMLPLDPPGADRATIGAVMACAEAGPLRLGYGTPRDHVLGLELVTGDGRLLQLGGRVMKNVAGYDLVRLAVGSRGTLGLVTRVTVRLRPRPDADLTLALRSPAVEGAVTAARRIRAERLEPVALELLSPELSTRVPAAGAWTLLVRIQGPAAAVDEVGGRVEALAREDGLAAERLDGAGAAAAWRALSTAEAGARVVLRFAGWAAELERTLRLAATVAGPTGWALAAHAGDGIVRVFGTADIADSARAEAAASVERARLTLATSGGTIHLERAPAPFYSKLDPWGPVSARELMQGIRRTFDPAGVLSPGRFAL